jgi:hypothetical protein
VYALGLKVFLKNAVAAQVTAARALVGVDLKAAWRMASGRVLP